MKDLIIKTVTNFCDLNIIQKTILLVILSSFLLLFIQNFIFSSSFDVLSLRSIDDYAFQAVLREHHENITSFRVFNLLELNDYGYGWLFWIIHITLTFPFYLTSLAGIDFLLISMARNISLCFMIGSCFFLFLSVKMYTKDKYIPFISILLFMSYPYFAFAALNFKTTAQETFFCILTFYLIIRNSALSKKDLKCISLSFAACLGTKLSTALLAPLVAIFLIDRFGFKIDKVNLKNALYFFRYFIPSAIFFINPALFLTPFNSVYFDKYWHDMVDTFTRVKTSVVSAKPFHQIYIEAFGTQFLNHYVLIVVVFMFLVRAISDFRSKKQNKFDSTYILIFLLFVTTYLCLTIGLVPATTYITHYFFCFSFLILFSLTALNRLNDFVRYIALALLVTLNLTLGFDRINDSYLTYHNKYHSERVQIALKAQNELQKLLGDPDQKLNLLIDFRAPVIYSIFKKNIKSITMFDNVSVVEKWSASEFDYILLHNDSRINYQLHIGDGEFKNTLDLLYSDPKRKNILVESRRMIKQLSDTGHFRESDYKIVYDKNKLVLFKKI